MLIRDILRQQKISFSFEFFPPKTAAGRDNLFRNISELLPLKPSSVSVTYGAGGSTRELTHDLVIRLQQETELTVASHLTCVGSSREEIREILERYQRHGIENILALRGDPPADQTDWVPPANGFRQAAELVRFIKENFPAMGIGVAGFPEGHPSCPNRLLEIEYLKAKVDAGADYIVTQLFFDNRDFYDFCERCELAGIRVPILAGIMPITSRRSMTRIADLAGGARFPAPLLRAFSRADSDEHVEKVGIHWATEQVRDLIDNNVRGVHFYTLNNARAPRMIYDSLGVNDSQQLAN
jgi:methylenetetrahydrofolate reductase (NADPH)